MMLQSYWDRHPIQYLIIQIVREGQWVTHVFEWIFMMVSRFAGYLMTLAVGYLIFYAIETKHSLDAIPAHPQFADQIAIYSNVIINVTPELVFPGVVVLCIRAFTIRRWVDAFAYLITTIAFGILTMVLLNAFMNGQITKDFLATMLFWRAGAALAYTVVVAYCSGHGGLDFKTLLQELDTLRSQLDTGQQTVSTLQEQLSSVQQRASSLQQQVDTGRQELSNLRRQLDAEKQRVFNLQSGLDTGQENANELRRELNTAKIEVETLQTQLDGKTREVDSLREMLENGQGWQTSRVSTLQQQLDTEQGTVITLRRQLSALQANADDLKVKLDTKERELESVQRELTTEQQKVSTLQHKLDTGQQATHGGHMDSGQSKASTGRGKVVQLDTSRPRKTGQDDTAERVGKLLEKEPGLSGRAIATRLSISPTTANKWKDFFENGGEELAK